MPARKRKRSTCVSATVNAISCGVSGRRRAPWEVPGEDPREEPRELWTGYADGKPWDFPTLTAEDLAQYHFYLWSLPWSCQIATYSAVMPNTLARQQRETETRQQRARHVAIDRADENARGAAIAVFNDLTAKFREPNKQAKKRACYDIWTGQRLPIEAAEAYGLTFGVVWNAWKRIKNSLPEWGAWPL